MAGPFSGVEPPARDHELDGGENPRVDGASSVHLQGSMSLGRGQLRRWHVGVWPSDNWDGSDRLAWSADGVGSWEGSVRRRWRGEWRPFSKRCGEHAAPAASARVRTGDHCCDRYCRERVLGRTRAGERGALRKGVASALPRRPGRLSERRGTQGGRATPSRICYRIPRRIPRAFIS